MLVKFFRDYRLPILSGFLIGTSYIPFPPWALSFALVPLWIFWTEQTSPKRIWWSGWVTQWLLTLIGFNWVAHTIHEFGQMPWPLAILGLALYSGFASLHVPLAGLIWFYAKRFLGLTPGRSLLLLPAAFIVAEMSYPMIFDWHLGYPLLPTGWAGVHLAEWIGFKGLSALVALVNGLLLWTYLNRKAKGPVFVGLGAVAGLLILCTVLGLWLKARVATPDSQASVLIVQANIGNLEKIEQERTDDARATVLGRYLAQTEAALTLGQPDFTVWPETAFPHLLDGSNIHTSPYAQQLIAFLQRHKLNLMTGGYGWLEQTRQVLNSFYLIKSDGTLADQPYSKTWLLAFGEYLPGADWFPMLREWLPQVGQFARGLGPVALTLNGLKVGPMICYEGLFDHFARDLARQGAQVLVNITNDSWYGTWQQPYQHMYMTVARAIEVRRPVIRSTNTGISTIALGSGEILAQSPLHQEWHHLYDLKYEKSPRSTLFMGWGYYFSWMVVAGLIFAASWRRRFEGTKKS